MSSTNAYSRQSHQVVIHQARRDTSMDSRTTSSSAAASSRGSHDASSTSRNSSVSTPSRSNHSGGSQYQPSSRHYEHGDGYIFRDPNSYNYQGTVRYNNNGPRPTTVINHNAGRYTETSSTAQRRAGYHSSQSNSRPRRSD